MTIFLAFLLQIAGDGQSGEREPGEDEDTRV